MKKALFSAVLLIILGSAIFAMTACKHGLKTVFEGNKEEKVTDVTDEVKGIEILTSTADISFFASEDGKSKVVAYDGKKIKYDVTVSEGVLKIKTIDERKWYERIFTFGSASLLVYLPKGEYAELVIDESTGNVTVPSCFKFDSIDIKLSTGNTILDSSANGKVKVECSTGDVTVQGISCEALEVKVSTGKTTITDVVCAENIDTECSTGYTQINNVSCKNLNSVGDTGDIEIKSLTASEHTYVERSTGHVSISNAECTGNITTKTDTGKTDISGVSCANLDITVSTGKTILSDAVCDNLKSEGDTGNLNMVNVIANGKYDIERSTGDVTFDGCDANEIYVETDTGEVEGTLLTNKIFIVNTDTGSVRVPESTTGGKCKITTDTGNIKISIKE